MLSPCPSSRTFSHSPLFARSLSHTHTHTVTVKHEQRKVIVDGPWPEKNWMSFDADARVGVLVRELRDAMSMLLERKVDEPDFCLEEHPVLLAVCALLRTNGALRLD